MDREARETGVSYRDLTPAALAALWERTKST
jgi:hypothetical protein